MQIMSRDAVVVEPVVTVEKLRTLLAVGCEVSSLDFKQPVGLDDHSEVVEFAKDIAAMRSCGGYLVIGADDQGNPTGTMTLLCQRGSMRQISARSWSGSCIRPASFRPGTRSRATTWCSS